MPYQQHRMPMAGARHSHRPAARRSACATRRPRRVTGAPTRSRPSGPRQGGAPPESFAHTLRRAAALAGQSRRDSDGAAAHELSPPRIDGHPKRARGPLSPTHELRKPTRQLPGSPLDTLRGNAGAMRPQTFPAGSWHGFLLAAARDRDYAPARPTAPQPWQSINLFSMN